MGKTTLLKTLMGIVKPSAGSVRLADRDVTGRAPYEIAQLGVAYVPEGRGIFGNLSVKENLVMAARPGTAGQRDWTYERVLETFPRLKERLNHGGQQLSGGEQQMLTIGRALMTNPDLLILDEATEGLAPLIAREIWRICGLIRASGISSIIVDKAWKHVTQVTDRNVILVKGEVAYAGSSDALRRQPELLERYLGV
jgi:branched-chain amino acid transport system ATP-binding protein